MSKWVRGIYNAAANFNMSGSLRAAAGRCLGRNSKQLREVDEQSDKRDESSFANQSHQSSTTSASSGTCTSACRKRSSDNYQYRTTDKNGNECIVNIHSTKCECGNIEYTINSTAVCSEGKGTGAWVRPGNESGFAKQTNNSTTDPVEYSTGIPTGVTV